MNTDNASYNSESRNNAQNRYDLNWQLCSEELGSIDLVAGLGQKNIVYSIARFFLGAVRSCALIFRKKSPDKTGVLFFVSSENQYAAVEAVARKVNNGSIVEITNPFSKNVDAYFPLYKAYCRAFLDIKSVIGDYRRNKNEYIKKAYRSRGDLLALAPGLLQAAIIYLRSVNPRVVVVSNDLVLWTRSIILAANYLGIKTVYLQHACVSEIVPPLDVNFAFLDGWSAAKKYVKRTPERKTEIYLTGGARHDPVMNVNRSIRQQGTGTVNVGLCVNMTDDLQVVCHIANLLSNTSGLILTIRPHPREIRTRLLRSIAREVGALWSDPKAQNTVQFISGHDSIVAGDSSILFEAALGGRKAISVQAMGAYEDYLGLISDGVVLVAKSDLELLDILHRSFHFHVSRTVLKNYYASVDSEWEGRSGELIAKAIDELMAGDQIRSKHFTKNSESSVFELYR